MALNYMSCLNKELIREILQMDLYARKIRDMFKGVWNKLYPAHNLGSLDDYKSSQLNISRFTIATKYVGGGGVGLNEILKNNI